MKTGWVVCDGACLGNPGPGGYGTITCSSEDWVKEWGGYTPDTTNNRMELQGLLVGLKESQFWSGLEKLHLISDSSYVLTHAEKYLEAWKYKKWITTAGTEVKNRDLWEEMDRELSILRSKGVEIRWHWVKGHNGNPLNERVDEIASAFAADSNPDLFQGPLAEYSLSFEIPTSQPRSTSGAKKSSAKGKYLSLVAGSLQEHDTWSECEARVKGVSAAKYRKFSNLQERSEILKSWGITNRS